MSQPAFSSKNSDQVYSLAFLTSAWSLFVMSSLNYKHLHWFPWLVGSRIALVLVGLTLLGLSVFKKKFHNNAIFWFFLVSLAVQASHGALEPSNQVEFYGFTGILVLATNLVYRGSYSAWKRIYGPLQLALLVIPLVFKSKDLLFPLGTFVDHFSLPVAGAMIGAIIARINSVKHQALLEIIKLQEEVLSTRKTLLEQEKSLRTTLEAELTLAKETLQAESKAKAFSELAIQVAHDIRSPLAALETVVAEIQSIPEERRLIIRSAVGRIRDIANHLLEKKTPSDVHEVQLLSGLIDALVSEKRMQFRSRLGIEIAAQLNDSAYGLFANVQPSEFKRVLSNLINNAVEALPDHGQVNVAMHSVGNTIEVRITDNGKGIPADILPSLTTAGVTYGKEEGLGLGLYYAQKTLKNFGGTLRLESSLGKGTTAIVTLPKSQPPKWFVNAIVLLPESQVVVLDDDESVHQIWSNRFLSKKLEKARVSLIHYSNPVTLMDSDNGNSSLYLIDYELLGTSITGLDVIEHLKIANKAVLVTSRFEEPAIRERCSRLKVPLIPKSMAGFVPIEITKQVKRFDAVLLDDDELVHSSWASTARQNQRNLLSFRHPEAFFLGLKDVNRETPVYIDSSLGNQIKGQDLVGRVKAMGFEFIYLATGYEPQSFGKIEGLTRIVGKEPAIELMDQACFPTLRN